MERNHRRNPELWFRPSPILSLPVLSRLFRNEELVETPRLGKRDSGHEKGYTPGTVVVARLHNEAREEQLQKRVRIKSVISKPLRDVTPSELRRTAYLDWQSLQQDLSFFEGRVITEDELVSIVAFSYLTKEEAPMNITTLLQEGTARIASLPPANWQKADEAMPLTVPLIAEDYPAKTAIMWNEAYVRFGLPDRNMMVVASTKDLTRITQVFREDSRYQGGGVGVGFKEVILLYLDEITPLAEAMGAVNIIKKVGGRLIGDNTDGEGYARSLENVLLAEGKPLKKAHVLMLGAGGSGHAIAFALAQKGARLTILNRTEAKARDLADSLNRYFGSQIAKGGGREKMALAITEADAVVSVIDDALSPLDAYSTIGDMELPVTSESIERNRRTTERLLQKAKRSIVISDIRIRKEPTAMLREAKALGYRTLDGIPMVVYQGVAAFWWLYGDRLTFGNSTRADVEDSMSVSAGL